MHLLCTLLLQSLYRKTNDTMKKYTFKDYLSQLPTDRQEPITQLSTAMIEYLPVGFEERVEVNAVHYEVPLSLYPAGYHANPKQPLPFITIMSQKNYIAIYHFGMYAHPAFLEWFKSEFPKYSKAKLEMGKSCIRLKQTDDLPLDLFKKMASKISLNDWITIYEEQVRAIKKYSGEATPLEINANHSVNIAA